MRTITYRGVEVAIPVHGPMFFLAVFLPRDDDELPEVVCKNTYTECCWWIKRRYETHSNGRGYVVDILMPDPTYYSQTFIPISRYWRSPNAS